MSLTRSHIAFVAIPKRFYARCVNPKPPLDMKPFAPKSFQWSDNGTLRAGFGLTPAMLLNDLVLSNYEKGVKKRRKVKPETKP
jgi:hypothetical protein